MKTKKQIKKHVFPDPEIEEIVEVEIEFVCPKRGKIKQKVKMKKLKAVSVNLDQIIGGSSDLLNSIDKDSSLDDSEEIEE